MNHSHEARYWLSSVLLLGLWLAGSVTTAAKVKSDEEQARDEWMAGYVSMENADKAETSGDTVQALDLFRTARETFLEVRRKYPVWNPSLLTYRIRYCETKISGLEQNVAVAAGAMNREGLLELTQNQADRIKALNAELLELKQKIDLTSESLERARREAARRVAVSDDAVELITENQRLQALEKQQQDKLATLTTALAALKAKTAKADVVRGLRDELTGAQAREAKFAEALETYRRAYNNVRKKLTAAGDAYDGLKTEYEQAKERTVQAEKERQTLADDLENLRVRQQTDLGEQARVKVALAALETRLQEMQSAAAKAVLEAAGLREYRDKYMAGAAQAQELLEKLKSLTKTQAETAQAAMEAEAARSVFARAGEDLRGRLEAAEKRENEQREQAVLAKVALEAELNKAQAKVEVLNQDRKTLQDQLGQRDRREREVLQLLEQRGAALARQTAELAALKETIAAREQTVVRTQEQGAAAELREQELGRNLAATEEKLRLREADLLKLREDREPAARRAPETAGAPPLAEPALDGRVRELEETLRGLRTELLAATERRQAAETAAAEASETNRKQAADLAKVTSEQDETRRQFEQLRQSAAAPADTTQPAAMVALREQHAAAAQAFQERLAAAVAERRNLEERLEDVRRVNATLSRQGEGDAKAAAAAADLERERAVFTKEREQWALKHSGLLTRVAVLEGKLEHSEQALNSAGKTVSERAELTTRLAAQTENITQLEQHNATLARQAEEARKMVEQQEAVLKSNQERIREMTTLAKLMRDKEAELQVAKDRATSLGEELTAWKTKAIAAEGLTTARQSDSERLRGELAAQAEKMRATNARLAALETARLTLTETETTLRNDLGDARERLRELQAQLARRTTAVAADAKHVAELEAAKADLHRRNVEQGAVLEKYRDEHEKILAKAEVVDGLSASLRKADADAATLQQQLAAAAAARDRSLGQLQETQRQLDEKESEVQRYRVVLAQKHDASQPAQDALVAQMSMLNRQLENEMQKRSALEAVLAERDSERPEAAGAVLARQLSVDERRRREHDEEFIARGLLQQGLMAEKQGNIEAARWNYRKLLTHDSANKTALARLGLIAAENGDDSEAARYLHQAFRVDPDDLDILIPLGFTLVRQEKADLAISMLSRAVALSPNNPAAHRCLGVACSSLGWGEAAEVQLRRALELDKKDGEAAFNLAILLASRTPARMDEARELYRNARRLGSPGDPGLDALFGHGK